MKKILVLLALGLSSITSAQDNSTYLTVDGLYAKAFSSKGYSARHGNGVGLNVSLEKRCEPHLGLGLTARGLGYRQFSDSSSFSGLDFFGRIIPFPDPDFEPYFLLSVGADYAADGSNALDRDPGLVLGGGFGAVFPFKGGWALDLGCDYVRRAGGEPLQQLQGRVGIQWRFGASNVGQAPHAEAAPLQTVKLASAAAPKSDRYLVQRGDSLWRIAARDDVYGNPYKYKKLAAANAELIKDPNLIYPDTKLVLP